MSVIKKLWLGIGTGILVVIVAAIFGIIAAIPIYFLWNWLMPTIFAIKTITFLQAWGIYFLSSMLFKSAKTKETN